MRSQVLISSPWKLVLLACVCAMAACSSDEQPVATEAEETRTTQVYAVNYPLAYFAERIGGDSVDVRFPAPPDVDPAYWSPSADVVADFQQADLILLNGAGYASWIQHATLPQSRLVDATAEQADRLIVTDDGPTHSHGPDGEHSHEGTAFTTWLDMEIAIAQAQAVFNALVSQLPAQEAQLRGRLRRLEADLEALHGRLLGVAERIGDQPLVFSHPVYQYLERAYDLNGQSVHWEPGEFPSEAQWRKLAGQEGSTMIWEGPPLAATLDRLGELGVDSLVFQPCGNRPSEGDFLEVMRQNVAALEQAFPLLEAN